MPRAVISDALGPIENYRLREYDPGPPAPGFVQIAVKAAGVSFVDVLTAEGGYQVTPPTPFIPGSECAGLVAAVGEGVTDVAVGDKVVASSFGGIFADLVNVRRMAVKPMPERMSFAQAAVFPVSYFTSWYALAERGELKAGETLLVLGAGGATGYAAVQIGKYLGARVIASASDEPKRALATSAGADAAIASGTPTWRDEVKAASGGKGIDVVFDPVGGPATELAFRCLGWKGRHLVVGFPAGIPSLPANLPLLKGASFMGVSLRGYGENEPEKAQASNARIFELAAQGVLTPAIARTYPLEDFAQALADAKAGRSAGRIVFVMDPAAA
jgi:NADPH2:quinone reductase